MLEPSRNVFDRVDAALAAAAVIGLALYLFVVPFVHPDRAARQHAPRDTVTAAARTFLFNHTGERLDGEPLNVRIRRQPALLDSLQGAFGRSEAVRHIRTLNIPAYYWEVRLTEVTSGGPPDDDSPDVQVGVSTDTDLEEAASIRLTLDGRPFHLTLDEDFADISSTQHASVLRSLTSDSLHRILVDSVSGDRWTFRFNDQSPGGRSRGPFGDDRTLNDPPEVRPFYLRPEARVLLNRADAAAIARYHLQGTLFTDDGPLGAARIDSVTLSGRDGRTTATVLISSAEPEVGRRYTASMEVAPTGSLLRLEPRFVDEAASGGPASENVLEILQLIAYVLLIILVFVVFLRRLRHQLIDVGAAAKDGVVGGVAAAIALSGQFIVEVSATVSLELLMVFLGIALMGLMAGMLIFFLSSTATSSARDVWNEKIQTLDLVREAYVRNVPVGASLLRGTAIGLVVLGVLSAALALLPADAPQLSSDPLFYTYGLPGSQFAFSALSALFIAFFVTYLIVVGPAALVRSRTSSAPIVVGVITVALLVTQTSPLEMRPVALSFALSGIIGVLIGWALWRYDVLSVFVSIFVFTLLWDVVPGWVVPTAPEWVDALLSLLLVVGFIGTGAAGVAGGRSGDDVPTIVPEYIEELTRRERLERELELARSMQLSFLPRENPEMHGLDVASICVPAYEVGGDYYDFFELDDRTLAFAVGDVSGKGMEAAFYMTLMKGILQSLVREGVGPARALARANTLFRMNASRNTFMSMALCVLKLDEGTLTFARAGHNPLLVRRSSGPLDIIQPSGAALGLADARMFEDSIEEISLNLGLDDAVIVYTDGVTEAMNPRRELYGEERLEAILTRRDTDASGYALGDAAALLRNVVDDVDAFRRAAPSHDDMTLVVVRRTASDQSSSSR